MRTRSQGDSIRSRVSPHLRESMRAEINSTRETTVHKLAPDSDEAYCTVAQRAVAILSADTRIDAAELHRLLVTAGDRFANGADQRRREKQRELETAARGASSGGALHCPSCGGDSITVQQKQTRSADEGMTIFCACEDCGRQWRMS